MEKTPKIRPTDPHISRIMGWWGPLCITKHFKYLEQAVWIRLMYAYVLENPPKLPPPKNAIPAFLAPETFGENG